MPSDPRTLLRSRSYLQLLVLAVFGVPVSAPYGFLALVNGLQQPGPGGQAAAGSAAGAGPAAPPGPSVTPRG